MENHKCLQTYLCECCLGRLRPQILLLGRHNLHAWERKGGKCLALDGVFLDLFEMNCLKISDKKKK